MAIGFLLATLPNWITWHRVGSPTYFADEDELECYIPTLVQAYRHHPWTVGDPALVEGGASLYPRLLFVPVVLVTKVLRWDPVAALFLWRAFAGLSLGLALYLLTRQMLGPGIWALLVAIVLLSEQGLTAGQPLYLHLKTGWHLLNGQHQAETDGLSRILRHFRLMTPGVNWAYLAIFIVLLNRLCQRRTTARLAAAGVAFGLLFYLYFYYWAAVAASLALMALLDRGRWRCYLGVLVLGGVLGIPSVAANLSAKASAAEGWLDRLQLFSHGHRGVDSAWPSLLAELFVFCGWFVAQRHRDLAFVICLAAVSAALSVHEYLTGIIMQNVHYGFISGPLVCLLTYVIAVRELRLRWVSSGAAVAVAIVFVGAMLVTGFSYRAWEAFNNGPAMANLHGLLRYRSEEGVRAALADRSGVLAGDRTAVKFAVAYEARRPLAGGLIYSHSVGDREWRERRMLDLFLQGLPLEEALVRADTYTGGFWAKALRDQAAEERERAERAALFTEIERDPQAWLKKFQVTDLVLPVGTIPPPRLRDHLQLLTSGQYWNVWECRF